MLLDAGADPNTEDNQEKSPIHLASEKGMIDVLKILLDAGADPNSKDNYGRFSLHYVCSRGDALANRELMVQQLVKHGASVNVEDKDRVQPLQVASEHTNVDIVRILLQAGADIKSRTDKRRTALHFASCNENQHL
ncbi:hypothetical protein CAPTEDRAFT_124690, partial [Capitella teleta]